MGLFSLFAGDEAEQEKMHPYVKRLSKKNARSKPVLGGSLFWEKLRSWFPLIITFWKNLQVMF